MQKIKTTRGEMYRYFGKKNILCVGYCELGQITQEFPATYYTCGVYGWNADIHVISNGYPSFAICCDYRPFGNEDSNLRAICEKYNKKLEKSQSKAGRTRIKNNFVKAVNEYLTNNK